MSLTIAGKHAIISLFLSGHDLSDIAASFALHRRTVERVCREAIAQLAELKAPNPTHLCPVCQTRFDLAAEPSEPRAVPINGSEKDDFHE